MLIVRNNERKAIRAAFAADRSCPFGGQHRVDGTSRTVGCSMPR